MFSEMKRVSKISGGFFHATRAKNDEIESDDDDETAKTPFFKRFQRFFVWQASCHFNA